MSMIGIDETLRYVREHLPDDEMGDRAYNRVEYECEKDKPIPFRMIKDKGRLHDQYTCRNCGHSLPETAIILMNYCYSCGYAIARMGAEENYESYLRRTKKEENIESVHE